jgi:hypothetical protein
MNLRFLVRTILLAVYAGPSAVACGGSVVRDSIGDDGGTSQQSSSQSSSAPAPGPDGSASSGSTSGKVTSLISGAYEFPVHYALVDPTLPYGPGSIRPDGLYSSFEIVLAGNSLAAFYGCNDAGTWDSQPIVAIDVRSASYTTPDGGLLLPVTPGMYDVGFVDASDNTTSPDPNATSSLALVWVGTIPKAPHYGVTLQAIASTGTVTLTTVEPGHVAGSFNVGVVNWVNGAFDMTNVHSFTGTFETTTCPGLSN